MTKFREMSQRKHWLRSGCTKGKAGVNWVNAASKLLWKSLISRLYRPSFYKIAFFHVRLIQCLLIPNSYFDWRYMTVFRFPYLCVPWLCVPYIFCSQPLLRKHLDFHTFMYPVVMYHIPHFFPVYFPTYFPSDFLLKKVEKRNFLTNTGLEIRHFE